MPPPANKPQGKSSSRWRQPRAVLQPRPSVRQLKTESVWLEPVLTASSPEARNCCEAQIEITAGMLPATNGAEIDKPYFHTEGYPFRGDQLDRQREALLVHLQDWDVECARKHLDAIKDSVQTLDDLHDSTLMEGEHAVNVLDLAGMEDAPGLYDTVTQQCRVVFTNEKRLVFTQANHSAEVGLPKMNCLASLLTCFHDRWSRRKWTSYYASIKASEVLQVFVQQTLTTSYQTSTCTFTDFFDVLCCPTGGKLKSEKDINGVTQTLGDHDPGSCMTRWDKTRFMRHALVIRYLDCASHSVQETTLMALASTPASKLYEMARAIDTNITIKANNWLSHKSLPKPLAVQPFRNQTPPQALIKQKPYKVLVFILLVVSLIFFAINPTAAVFMLIAVFAAVFGAYSGSKSPVMRARKAAGFGMFGSGSKTTVSTNAFGLAVYLLSFFLGIGSIGSGDPSDTGTGSSFGS
ncbi:unnamed protein product [Ectocarpus sp. 6 AP-2014]